MERQGYDSIAAFGDVKVLKNKYFLPLGFSYNKYIPHTTFSKLSVFQKDRILFKAFVIDDKDKQKYTDFNEVSLDDTSSNLTFEEYGKLVDSLKQDALVITEHHQNVIKGTVNSKAEKMMFFSIPYDRGWSVKIDGKEVTPELINIGFIGLFINKGAHTIELNYTPPYLKESAAVSFAGVLIFCALFFADRIRRKKRKDNLSSGE